MVLEAITDSVTMVNTIEFTDYSIILIHNSILEITFKYGNTPLISLHNFGWLIKNELKETTHGLQLFHKNGYLLVEIWKRGKINSRRWIALEPKQ